MLRPEGRRLRRGLRLTAMEKRLPSSPSSPWTTSLKYTNLPIFSPFFGRALAKICQRLSRKRSSPKDLSWSRTPEFRSALSGVGCLSLGFEYAPFPPNNWNRVWVSHFLVYLASRFPPQSASKMRKYNVSLRVSGTRMKMT